MYIQLIPDSPEVIKQTLFQLREQQSDCRLCIHTDDSLSCPQSCVSHIFIFICQSLEERRDTIRDTKEY